MFVLIRANHEFIEDNAKRPNIDSLVVVFAKRDLRWSVAASHDMGGHFSFEVARLAGFLSLSC